MRICVLGDDYEGSVSPLKEVDFPYDPRPYLAGHDCDRAVLTKATAVSQVVQLAQQGYDVFMNLCDGAWDEDRPGIEVVQALERLGVAFTGASSTFYEPSREAMKRVCHAWGVKTPAGVMVRDEEGIARAARVLRFPLLVKHPSSYSSIGMTRDSRVETTEALAREARRMIASYGGALVEEFVAGREFSVLVAEDPDRPDRPTAYPPVEIVFPPGETFKHFQLKWVDYEGMDCVPCADPELAERLCEASRLLFLGLDGAGYGRCDVRVDAAGEVWMLEINPNCGVFYPPEDPGTADLILDLHPEGHAGFVDQILRAALRRRERRRRRWEVRPDREGTYAMFASEPIRAGELVERYEEEAHHLVSRRHVEKHWDARHREWFDTYAWPLSDDVWVIWSPDPEDWRPINHSCDPSAWLEGLDVVARRDIAAGEEITVDYATFCTEPMRPFACSCGAPSCRGTVRGSDHREVLVDRYGEHASDLVRQRRAAARAAERDAGGFLTVARRELERLRKLAEGAIGQLSDEEFFTSPGNGDNSVALVVKHLAGNMRSRWSDFLTSDGEKADRDRDREFVLEPLDSRSRLMQAWARGWSLLGDALAELGPGDLDREVRIRREAHSVREAIARQLSHYAYHVGQLVFLAKHLTGERWQTLSVPRGASRAFNEAPTPYLGGKRRRMTGRR